MRNSAPVGCSERTDRRFNGPSIEALRHLDCLIIGHNDGLFTDLARRIKSMGTQSCSYRDFSLNFVDCDGVPKTLGELLTAISRSDPTIECNVSFYDTFSATIAYLGSYLHRRGYSIEYIHDFQSEKQRLQDILKHRPPLCVAITSTYYVTPEPLIEVVEYLRECNRQVTIIVGGPFITSKTRALDDPDSIRYLLEEIGADLYVNCSQGEGALVSIIDSLKAGTSLQLVNNIYYRASGGDFVSTEVRPENNDLSSNRVTWLRFANRIGKYANVRTAISCPFSCEFCGFPELAGQYRTMSLNILQEELDELDRMRMLKGVQFVDDTFNIPQKRFRQLLEMMVCRSYRFHWFANFRCQFADEETVALMRQSGCRVVFLGLESGSNRILQNMRKQATIDEYFHGISLLKKYDIITFGSFIIGFPGETADTVHDTMVFLRDSNLDFYRANLWYCDQNTPVWKRRDEYGLKGGCFEWQHDTMGSSEACSAIEHIFLNVSSPTWLPIQNFDIEGVWRLTENGFDLSKIKGMVRLFNESVALSRLGQKMNVDAICRRLSHSLCGRAITVPQFGELNSRSLVVKC